MSGRAARLIVCAVVAGLLAAFLPVAGVSSSPAQAGVQPFELGLVEGGGQLQIRGAEAPVDVPTPTTLAGSLEPATGVISEGSLSVPTISFTQEITDPIVATVFIDAAFSQIEPPMSGSIDSQGNLILTASLAVDLHIEVGDPAFIVTDCRAAPIELSLESTTPYDPDTGRVTLADADFSVPPVAASGSCDAVVAPAVNDQLAGAGHSLTMTVEGDLELPPPPDEASVTTLVVTPEGGARLGDDVTLTATVAPGEGSEVVPTGFVDFLDGSTVLATVPLDEGTAEFVTSSLAADSHSLRARYRGDSTYAASASAPVSYLVAATPSVTSTLPEFIEIGAESVEFDVTISNPGVGAPVTNARLDVAIARALGNAPFTPEHVVLEHQDDAGVWQPVDLATTAPLTVSAFVAPATGFPLPSPGDVTRRMRVRFGPAGSPVPLPGPFRVTIEVAAVDPTTGTKARSVTGSEGTTTLVEAERRDTTITFLPPFFGGPLSPHTVRQGNKVGLLGVQVEPQLRGVRATGFVEVLLDGSPIDVYHRIADVEAEPVARVELMFNLPIGDLDVMLPPTIAPGTHQLTVKYSGDALFKPSTATVPFTVVPGVGAAYECTADRVPPGRFRANVVALANLPSSRRAGEAAALGNFDLRLLIDRGQGTFQNLAGELENDAVNPVGASALVGIDLTLGSGGTGTADAIERTGGVVMPATPNPATDVDQVLRFHGARGTVPIDGAPGDVVPVTLEHVEFRTLPLLPATYLCTPVGDPIVLGEVTIAGTTLAVSPSGPVPAGTEVTLTANTFPADAPGLVLFRDGDQDIGVVPVVDGQATMTTNELPAGTRSLTARFFGGLTVPSTVSDPVALEVVAPEISVAPATGLLDGEPLDVTVSNLIPGGSYELATCRGAECVAGQPSTATPDGTVATTVPAVQRFTSTSGSHLVCRADCEVVLTGPGAAEGRATFAMAEGTLTVTPDEQLVDGQAVQVTGSELMPTYEGPLVAGVLPTGQWQVLQCDRQILDHPHLFGVWAFCALPTQNVTVNGSTLDVVQPVRATITRILGGTTDCTTEPEACVLGLVRFEQDTSTTIHLVPLRFNE